MWHSVQGVHRKPLITKRRKAELTEAKPSKKTLFLWDPKAATQEALQTWLLLWGLSRFGRAGMVGCGNHINIDYILRWPTSVGRAKNIAHLCLSNKSILNPGKCTQVFWDLLTFSPKKEPWEINNRGHVEKSKTCALLQVSGWQWLHFPPHSARARFLNIPHGSWEAWAARCRGSSRALSAPELTRLLCRYQYTSKMCYGEKFSSGRGGVWRRPLF